MSQEDQPTQDVNGDEDIAVESAQDKPQAEPDKEPQAEDQATTETALSPEEEIHQLKSRLAEVEKSLAEADLRAQAEVQNMRRRVDRDIENAHKYALEKFSKDILAVADSLERGLQTLGDDEQLAVAKEGTSLTLKMLLDVMGKYQIEQIDPQGEPFDPQLHEAMTMVPNPDLEPNTVMDVVQKGYTLSGRLIRPAMVVVSKQP